jgi:hypothetical protein
MRPVLLSSCRHAGRSSSKFFFVAGTLKENRNASRNFSSKAQYQISCSYFESLLVVMGVEMKIGI